MAVQFHGPMQGCSSIIRDFFDLSSYPTYNEKRDTE
jgi:hypothetical protein